MSRDKEICIIYLNKKQKLKILKHGSNRVHLNNLLSYYRLVKLFNLKIIMKIPNKE